MCLQYLMKIYNQIQIKSTRTLIVGAINYMQKAENKRTIHLNFAKWGQKLFWLNLMQLLPMISRKRIEIQKNANHEEYYNIFSLKFRQWNSKMNSNNNMNSFEFAYAHGVEPLDPRPRSLLRLATLFEMVTVTCYNADRNLDIKNARIYPMRAGHAKFLRNGRAVSIVRYYKERFDISIDPDEPVIYSHKEPGIILPLSRVQIVVPTL